MTFYSDVNIITGASNTIKDLERDPEKDLEKDPVSLVQQKILKLFSDNPRITIKAISIELGINERNVRKNIKTLKDAGLIERIGSDRSGHWVVK